MPRNPKPSNHAALDVAVLVSVGRHPLTARTRRADQDARAVEMALSLSGAAVRLIHAGGNDADNQEALRGYLGMGLGGLDLIEQAADADVVPALAEALRDTPPQLVLTGTRAETGESSGLVPYLLAKAESGSGQLLSDVSPEQGAEALCVTRRGSHPGGPVGRCPTEPMIDGAILALDQHFFGVQRHDIQVAILVGLRQEPQVSLVLVQHVVNHLQASVAVKVLADTAFGQMHVQAQIIIVIRGQEAGRAHSLGTYAIDEAGCAVEIDLQRGAKQVSSSNHLFGDGSLLAAACQLLGQVAERRTYRMA
jgi:hypothetical protein